MIKKLVFSALATALLCPLVNGKTYSETEYNIRPWEIIKGLQPHSKLLWDTDNNGIDAFTVSSNSKLTVWDKTKLWGNTVTRIDLPTSGSVTLRLKNPIQIR